MGVPPGCRVAGPRGCHRYQGQQQRLADLQDPGMAIASLALPAMTGSVGAIIRLALRPLAVVTIPVAAMLMQPPAGLNRVKSLGHRRTSAPLIQLPQAG